MLKIIEVLDAITSLFEKLQKYINWKALVMLLSGMFYPIASFYSPLIKLLGLPLTVGLVLPVGLILVFIVIKSIENLHPKIKEINTYFDFEYKSNTIVPTNKKDVLKGNIDYYNYQAFVAKDSESYDVLKLIFIFHKATFTSSIKINSGERQIPTINTIMRHHKAVSIELINLSEGNHKITFND
jgi:hypothetical protein